MTLLATTKTEDQVKGRLFLDVVVAQGSSILQLLSGKDESLLVRWNALPDKQSESIIDGTTSCSLVLDFRLDIVDGVRGLDLESDGLSRQAEVLHQLSCSMKMKADHTHVLTKICIPPRRRRTR